VACRPPASNPPVAPRDKPDDRTRPEFPVQQRARACATAGDANDPAEEWREVPGYEGYEASSLGRIRSLDRYLELGQK
jgi:hypothetical protein